MPSRLLNAVFSLALVLLTCTLAFPILILSPTHAASAANDLMTDEARQEFLADPSHLIIQASGANHSFTVELAVDDATRTKGLMYRTKMAPDSGMLFDFGESRDIYMWMKNTYVSLDMLFVDETGTIRHLVKSTTPLSQSIIGSGGAVRYVLEVKSGTVERIGIKSGDKLHHQLFTPKSSK